MNTAPTPLRARCARRPRLHTLALAAAVAVAVPAQAAVYNWNSGTFVPGATAPNPLAAGDFLEIGAGGYKYFDAATFDVTTGTVNWNADALYLQNGGVVNNGGLWQAMGDNSLFYNGGAQPAFNNTGTFRKAGGIGTTNINNNVGFSNSGVIDAQTGIIAFGGGASFNAGSVFTGAGAIQATAGNNTFSGAFSSSNLNLVAGTHTGNAAVVGGTVKFSGGTLSGTWAVAAGQALTGADGGFKYLSGAATTLTNQGSLVWGTANYLYLQHGATLVNQGLFSATQSFAVINNGGVAPVFNNIASGTVRAEAGRTLNFASGSGLVNSGTLEAAAGAYLTLSGGAQLNAGSIFTGAGVVEAVGNNTFSGAFSSSNLVLLSGTHTGSAAMVGGSVKFSGGTLAGTWTVAAGQTLAGISGSYKYLDGAATTLTNQGSLVWNTTNPLYMQQGATLDNQGLFSATQSSAIYNNGGAQPVFNNSASGTVRAEAGVMLNFGSGSGLVNSGTLEAATGAVLTLNGGAQLNAGSTFTGAGMVHVYGNNTFNGAFASDNLFLVTGTHTGNAAVVGGSVKFLGGTLAGTWAVAAGQTLTGAVGNYKYLDGAATTLTNQGNLVWDTTNPLHMQNGAALVNAGTLDLSTDTSVVYNGGTLPTFTNTGLIVKSAGAGTATIGNSLGFDNLGTVRVDSGTLALPGNFGNNGVLAGAGTFSVAGMLTNAGALAPGASPGTLSLTGNYTQTAAGIFAVELESLASHDLFNISGTAALGGTLALSCWANCALDVGDVVTILDSVGNLSGSFSDVTLSGFATGAFDIVYDTAADRVQLVVTEAVTAVPEPGTGALWLAGVVALGAVARRRRAR